MCKSQNMNRKLRVTEHEFCPIYPHTKTTLAEGIRIWGKKKIINVTDVDDITLKHLSFPITEVKLSKI